MDLGLSGRLALVTGASRGIGRGIAAALAAEGARVVLVARGAEALEAVRQTLPAAESHHCVALDLMTDGAAEQLAAEVAELGDLEILVQNLGGSNAVWDDTFGPLEDWLAVWKYNLGVAHELNRRFIPAMVTRRWGRVVHLSTLSARTFNGYPAYVTAKSGLTGYVKSLARTVAADNVVITAVAPGAIYIEGRHFANLQRDDPDALERYYDESLPTHRLGTADDVGSVVAFLCSEQASFMAGSIVEVDGGGS